MYNLRRDHPRNRALPVYERLVHRCAPLDPAWIPEAAEFRLATRRGLSHADALGYTAARSLGLRFLTGDAAFRGLPGVEFVR